MWSSKNRSVRALLEKSTLAICLCLILSSSIWRIAAVHIKTLLLLVDLMYRPKLELFANGADLHIDQPYKTLGTYKMNMRSSVQKARLIKTGSFCIGGKCENHGKKVKMNNVFQILRHQVNEWNRDIDATSYLLKKTLTEASFNGLAPPNVRHQRYDENIIRVRKEIKAAKSKNIILD